MKMRKKRMKIVRKRGVQTRRKTKMMKKTKTMKALQMKNVLMKVTTVLTAMQLMRNKTQVKLLRNMFQQPRRCFLSIKL